MLDLLANELTTEPVIDYLAEEERRRNPPYLCECNHTLMVHAEQGDDGIWTHQVGPCHMAGCECVKAIPVG